MATAAPASSALPRWDLSSLFSSLESPEYAGAVEALASDIAALRAFLDERGIGAGEGRAIDDAATLDDALERLNQALDRLETVFAYVYAFVSTDSRDETAQARLSELIAHQVALRKLETRMTAWIGTLDAGPVLERAPYAREHAFAVRRAAEAAGHLMSPAEEDLAAELDVTGSVAWSKLYGDTTSQLVVAFDREGERRDVAISELRALAHDPDRDTRRRAYKAELAAWERAAVPLAAAMNSIKGQVDTLAGRRAWGSPLEQALWQNHVDDATVDAMLSAIREMFPQLRRYLRAKADVLGVERLAWYDLAAPLPRQGDAAQASDAGEWTFDRARAFVLDRFAAYSSGLHDYAARVFAESWVDAEPRPGKVDGAFCMHLVGDESRILMNFTPSHRSVTTLAHELGHAYHNLVEADLTPLQRRTPMTLAETASTFCETLVRHAALAEADDAEQLDIVEGALEGAVGILVDTTSRFFFEQRVMERRRARELSVAELCGLMREAQLEAYGDALDPDALHPYMWAAKPHYYSNESFYNYPYSFGLLFGLGLYRHYVDDPGGFRGQYDDLLASTGSATAAELGARFGVDVRSEEFWRRSLDVVVEDVDRFEVLVATGPA
jgi:pepF/M3 family oligoendopeptidase